MEHSAHEPDEVDADEQFAGRGISESGQSSAGNGLRIYCFSCHRPEYHQSIYKGRSFYPLLIGMTFGLIVLFGSYRCRCCGARRFCRYNFLNLSYYFHRRKYRKSSRGTIKPSRRSPRSSSQGGSSNSSTSDSDEGARSSDASDFGDPERSSFNHASFDEPTAREIQTDVQVLEDDEPELIVDEDAGLKNSVETEAPRRRRKRKSGKLKSVPIIDSIGKARREKQRLEKYSGETEAETAMDYSIEGLMGSFETAESRKMKIHEREERLVSKEPFVAKPSRASKKSKSKRKKKKIRVVKKTRVVGRTLYCFGCHQSQEHHNILKQVSAFALLMGITLGTIGLLGPFRCSVCAKKRLWISNYLNPKYYIRKRS